MTRLQTSSRSIGLLGLLLLPLALMGVVQDQGGDSSKAPTPASAPTAETAYRVDRGAGQLDMFIPRDEVLEFVVLLDVAVIGDTHAGTFVLSSGVESYRAGLPRPGAIEASAKRMAWVRGQAEGHYLNYTLDHVIETRYLPQEWPRVIYRDTQTGSENRRRELMIGDKAGVPTSLYRRDTHCDGCKRREHFLEGGLFSEEHHCKKCKRGEHRLWVKPEVQEIPEHAVDMLSAIHLARAMVQSGTETVKFPLLDKQGWWNVTLNRAQRQTIKTKAGSFNCRAIKLTPLPGEGKTEKEEFKGLFGIHGTLSIFLEETTGVPVKIEGSVPLGPFEVDVALELSKYSGTPAAFSPLGKKD